MTSKGIPSPTPCFPLSIKGLLFFLSVMRLPLPLFLLWQSCFIGILEEIFSCLFKTLIDRLGGLFSCVHRLSFQGSSASSILLLFTDQFSKFHNSFFRPCFFLWEVIWIQNVWLVMHYETCNKLLNKLTKLKTFNISVIRKEQILNIHVLICLIYFYDLH